MSLTLNQMIADIQSRIPIGLQSAYITDRLNESFRWIQQQDAFVWSLRRGQVTVAAATVDFSLPADTDQGEPMMLYGQTYKQAIPFVPFEKWSSQEIFNQTLPTNTFSAWTLINENGTTYKGKLAPDTPLGAPVTLNLFYHVTYAPVTSGSATFPIPNDFDSALVDLCEAEIKRRYSIAGWADIQSKATEEIKRMIPDYRSSKRTIEGMAETALNAQETQLSRSG